MPSAARARRRSSAATKAYHGVTVASASLTGLPNNHRDFDLPIANILHVDCPHFYRFGLPGETEEAFASRMADSLEQRILSEGADTVAAMIAEPIMGAGGVILPPATYWEKIQAVLREIRRPAHRRRSDLRASAARARCGEPPLSV